MSNEHRITNLEKLTLNLGTRIEESASDTAEELRTIRQEIKQSHLEIGAALDSHAGAIERRLDAIEKRLDATATKDDISEIKGLLQQLVNKQKP